MLETASVLLTILLYMLLFVIAWMVVGLLTAILVNLMTRVGIVRLALTEDGVSVCIVLGPIALLAITVTIIAGATESLVRPLAPLYNKLVNFVVHLADRN